MKILDRYILTSFITTFATVFVILFFIFILQGIWLFIAELAGKDLDAWLIVKFLLFYSPKMIPLVLPLSILLASIMTFGSFAENYEFAAMKSSGISLGRAMRSLTVFIFGLSFVAFLFANNVIPKAEFKFINLRKSILQRKPAMAIAEGQFNAIGTFNIKVDKKSGENDEKLQGITIHKRTVGAVNATIIRAKTGLLSSNESSNQLQLELFDGYYYEEVNSENPVDREKLPFAKSSFSKQIMNIDLTVLNSNDDNDDQIANTNTMLNVAELNYTIDSLQVNFKKDALNIADNIAMRTNTILARPPVKSNLAKPATEKDTVAAKKGPVTADPIAILTAKSDKIRVYDNAIATHSSADFSIESGKNELAAKIKNINSHWLALYDKFVIAFACILMFFIGAPLGAIIRKGGLGLPIVFAVLIFITFHFINTFGKKVAQENGITPFLGAWMSSIVLSPLAVLFTYRATNDMGVSINFDWLVVPFRKLMVKEEKPPLDVLVENLQYNDTDSDWVELKTYSDEKLTNIVKNYRQYSYNINYRNTALKVLDSRGITQDDLKRTDSLYNKEYLKLINAQKRYTAFTRSIFVCQALIIILSGASSIAILLALLPLVFLVMQYIFIYKSQESLEEIEKVVNRKIGVNTFVTMLFGFPFYIIIYFYTQSDLKQAIKEYSGAFTGKI